MSVVKATQLPLKPIPTLDLPALQSASRVIQEQLVKDAQAVPELGDMLTIRELVVPHSLSVMLISNKPV